MAFEFKIQLQGISKPPVWRKLKMPENATFEQFHLAIQNAFGWDNYHAYMFSPEGYGSEYQIEPPNEWPEGDSRDAQKIKLKDIFSEEKQTFIYTYDFGDDWEHKITLERITPEKVTKPSCIKGKGKCPPEDCGGIWGYPDFLDAVSNPDNPEYEEMREWAGLEEGEEWDVNEFDLEKTNARMSWR